MTNMLVIGGGLLGLEVARISRDNFATALTYHSHPVSLDGVDTHAMDIRDDISLIEDLSPDYVVLAAAMTNVDRCEIDREQAWRINAIGPRRVATASLKAGAKLIYISTDYVFDGTKGLYKEEDAVAPINVYGESKLQGERFVMEIIPDALIARTSVLYGTNQSRCNFVTWIIDELNKRKTINIVVDQYNSPTLSSNLAEMILRIRDKSGIFHACGSECISRYEFAIKTAEVFGLDKSLINPIASGQLSWKAKRPRNSSLDVSKISKFAQPLNAEEGLMRLAKVAIR